MLNRSKWTIDDAEAVTYLLAHRLNEMDDFERSVVEGLAKKRALKDTISVNQRVFFDGLWELKAPSKSIKGKP